MSVISQTIETLGLTRIPTAKDYQKANLRGLFKKMVGTLTGRSTHLLEFDTISDGRNIQNHHYCGAATVRIDQIKGSEGRCQDFDQDFNPLKLRNQGRWLSIARAWHHGVKLPTVDLIKVGDVYIVRDGHHRISVARYMGADFIDACVTEWVLAE
jgi:hypothetical protein